MHEKLFESIFIKLQVRNETIICGTIYRSPSHDTKSNQTFIDKLQKTLELINTNHKCFIFGDFNYDLLQIDNKLNDLLDTMSDNSFYSLISKPTRITETSATILDHVWTNLYSKNIKTAVLLHPLSDHLPILMCYHTNQIEHKPDNKIRTFNEANIKHFQQELENSDMNLILQETDPNTAFCMFKDKYCNVFNHCFPLVKNKTRRKTNNWFDVDLQKLIKEKDKLFKKYIAKKSIIAKANYNAARNRYFRCIQEKKKAFFASVLEKQKQNIRKTWQIINNLLGKPKNHNCTSLNVDGQISANEALMANHFNIHFATVGSVLSKNIKYSSSGTKFNKFLGSSYPHCMYINPTCVPEIKKILSVMQSKNSCGLDEIPMSILKRSPDNILFILCHIFNLSLAQGKFICDFKKAKVIPVHKKGSKLDVNNYRPISLLPVMSKILERIVYKRLHSFLNQAKFFHQHQFGFRKKHSTSNALTVMIEHVTKAFEEKKYTLGVFLDLSKAFDTIDHDILLYKLQHYGVRGLPYEWFKSYLSNRSLRTEINGKLSSPTVINLGVPQGSILGPLLFLIYVNDLPKCLNTGQVIMFADDTNLFFNNKSYSELFRMANEELLEVSHWLAANRLTLNTSKTKFIIFRTVNSPPVPPNLEIKLNGNLIEKVASTRFLGVTIHEHLTWKPHMESLLKKIRINLGIMRKVKPYLNSKSLQLLYYSMIQSHFQYCISSWCFNNKTLVYRLQKTVNKAIQLAFNPKNDNLNAVMRKHNILSIEQTAQLEIVKFMHNYIHNLLPSAFNNFYQRNLLSCSTDRSRSKAKIFPQFCRIKLTQQSFKYKGPVQWNKLPATLRETKSTKSFIIQSKQYLLSL